MAEEQRRFSVSLRGYSRTQVDAFCARIERTMAGDAGPDAVTPDEVRHVQLDVEMGGYSEEEVDAFLDQAEAEVRQARDRGGAAQSAGPAQRPEDSARSDPARFRRATELFALESRPRGERFTRTRSVLQEGYDVNEVDAFVDEARGTLGTRLRASEIANVRFATTRRGGYDMKEVDDWLDQLHAALSA